jgi:transcriptional regulator MraZ
VRGSYQAKIDEKGRLKLPSSYRTDIESEWKTPGVYLTCDDATGQYVRIYPLAVWQEIEARLKKMPTTDQSRRRFERWTSLYGLEGEIDTQGRVLIPPQLREPAAMQGDVVVMGQPTFLEVWNRDRFMGQSDAQRLTDDDYRRLSEFGI